MSKKLIKNGEIVSEHKIFPADILIEDDKIKAVGPELLSEEAEIFDAQGMLVFPGFIDTHTHLDMDTGTAHTADDFYSGTKAAVAGGTTTVLDFATQNKGETLMQALANWHKLADKKSSCDYGFHMAITDWNEEVAAELPELAKRGVTSYKLYMAYDNLRVCDAQVYKALKAVKQQGGIIGMHCENGDLVNELVADRLAAGDTGVSAHPRSRPDTVEAEAINRFLAIASLAACPVNIVHLSTRKGLDIILHARAAGQKVYIETCPQYLLLEDSVYETPDFEGAKFVMSPPLRKYEDTAALWAALRHGAVDTIGTDHCPFLFKDKKLGLHDFSKIPNGAPGVDLRPQLMYTYGVCENKITLPDFCRVLAENPAKLFGMYPQKGAILAGSDADVVIWDKNASGIVTNENQHSACDYTPYNGLPLRGAAKYVFVRGRLVAQNGIVQQEKCGNYVSRGVCQFWR